MNDNSFNILNNNVKAVGYAAKTLIMNNTLHVIGGHFNSCHLAFNKNSNKFEKVTDMYKSQYV